VKFIKRSTRQSPKITLILVDWSVRESFHVLHYLSKQDIPRDTFEVIVIEYYSRVSDAIKKFEDQADTWLLLEMPEDCYYHKHLMYNVGIVLARGEICVICDSDAMVKKGFIKAIIDEFDRDPRIVLHLDQFRNNRRDFYPFNFPSFKEVEGEGCINNAGGRTTGVLDSMDPIHTRNYGACMCARRADLLAIGGADEHIDYLGHICGPYDMTFRLVNFGRREIWHQSEFLYHTWHPGQAGVDNYLGPHDGRHMSTTSLTALVTGRRAPLLENPAIRMRREQPDTDPDLALNLVIRPSAYNDWLRKNVESGNLRRRFDGNDIYLTRYHGFHIYKELDVYYAHLALDRHGGRQLAHRYLLYTEAGSLEAVRAKIDGLISYNVRLGIKLAKAFVLIRLGTGYSYRLAGNALGRSLRALISITSHIAGQLTRLPSRFWCFIREMQTSSESLEDLVTNLYFLRRNPDSNLANATILVENRKTLFYLRTLIWFAIIPPAELKYGNSASEVLKVLQAAKAQNGSKVLLSRLLYWRYYPLIKQSTTDETFIII
jgi:hypothetical protein